MAKLIDSLKQFFSKKHPLPAGMYSFQTSPDAEKQYRLHLRIDEDGSGILVINAATVLHLNQTAAEYAYHLIKDTETDVVADEIARRYQIDREQARQDFLDLSEKVYSLIEMPDLDPVLYLGIERQEPFSAKISAPYRLDCALTYRVNTSSRVEDAPHQRVDRELSHEEWVTIFHKVYNAGIPHLLFTGGEPTLRDDLPDLISTAEELGLVTGLLTDGRKLLEDDYRNQLLVNGLDHLMILLDPEESLGWEILQKVLPEDVHTTVHITVKDDIDLKPQIKRLAEMGANALSLSAPTPELASKLESLRDFAASQQLELVWNMPVPYSSNNPVSLELEADNAQHASEGAGKAWLYVEPDGDVLPAQGMYDQVLGNLLTDSWEAIWEKH